MTRRVRPAAVTLRSATLYRLLAALALVVVPHALHLPLWLSGVAVGLGIWRYIAARRQLRLPPTWLRIALTVLTLGAIFGQYGTLLGRDAGAALLIAMLGLKLLELREPRDVYVVGCLGYFLVIVHFLYSQTPLLVVYMLATVVLLTATLIDLNRREHAPLRPLLRLAATLVGYAVPLMLAAFILFPRISGPLWGLPNDAYSGMSGLSNEMAPGRISQLSLSDAVAFRVEFEGALPPPQQRYWRGPVFSLTDGERWRGGPLDERERGAPSFVALGAPFRYSVTLEPHDQRWLFALDLPAELPAGARASEEFQLYAPQAVRERQRYTLTSYPDYRTVDMSEAERRRTLQLPAEGSPRARALAADWRAHATSSADVVQAALRMYREQNFVYTLTPPRIDDDFVDGFLFGTRRGFCEHYAASFAFLMRAAGIPARVVTGYQGGELNSIGNYLVVRQRDAHAWTEVWLGDSGWLRVDPTAAVAPERIERGIDPALQRASEAVRFSSHENAWLGRLARGARQGWDAFNNRWNQWVLAYGPERQRSLLGWFSLVGFAWQTIAACLLAAVGATLAWVVLQSFTIQRNKGDAVTRCYQRFCAKLARRGLARLAHEGPADYARRARDALPGVAHEIDIISQLYIALRYQRTDPRRLALLCRKVRAFRP